jgi:glycosyltransferase involved in cell wall biosynthesis
MKIVFIGPLPNPVTGQSLACRVLLRSLEVQHQVVLVDLSKKEFRQGISSASRLWEVLGVLRQVWRARDGAAAIYLTVSESFAGNVKDLAIYGLCFSRLRHMVIHLHGGAGMSRIMRGEIPPLRTLNAFFLKRLGGVIVLGKAHLDIYRGIVADARLHIVPNFAEDELFTTPELIDLKFHHTHPLRLLFLSNLLPGKGHEELIDAFLGLKPHVKGSIRLDLAGGFETTHQKEAFLAKIAGVEQIQYHGTVGGARKKTLFNEAHLFCLPTYYPYEGQPISILEAYASGCAVMTTDHSGIPDVFADDVNGFQVKPRSVADVRSVIERAAADPEILHRMARTNFETAQTRYRTSQYQRAVTQVIDAVAKAK